MTRPPRPPSVQTSVAAGIERASTTSSGSVPGTDVVAAHDDEVGADRASGDAPEAPWSHELAPGHEASQQALPPERDERPRIVLREDGPIVAELVGDRHEQHAVVAGRPEPRERGQRHAIRGRRHAAAPVGVSTLSNTGPDASRDRATATPADSQEAELLAESAASASTPTSALTSIPRRASVSEQIHHRRRRAASRADRRASRSRDGGADDRRRPGSDPRVMAYSAGPNPHASRSHALLFLRAARGRRGDLHRPAAGPREQIEPRTSSSSSRSIREQVQDTFEKIR